MPVTVAASVWQIPHASTRIRTCPDPGSETCRSTTRSMPGAETSTALYVPFIWILHLSFWIFRLECIQFGHDRRSIQLALQCCEDSQACQIVRTTLPNGRPSTW